MMLIIDNLYTTNIVLGAKEEEFRKIGGRSPAEVTEGKGSRTEKD